MLASGRPPSPQLLLPWPLYPRQEGRGLPPSPSEGQAQALTVWQRFMWTHPTGRSPRGAQSRRTLFAEPNSRRPWVCGDSQEPAGCHSSQPPHLASRRETPRELSDIPGRLTQKQDVPCPRPVLWDPDPHPGLSALNGPSHKPCHTAQDPRSASLEGQTGLGRPGHAELWCSVVNLPTRPLQTHL